MRRELFALHLPNPDRVQADYAVLAELSKGLSGGDILNVCVNAIYAGSVDADPAKWAVTQGMIEEEISKVKNTKAEHSGERNGPRRRIGFCQRKISAPETQCSCDSSHDHPFTLTI
jgi:hypothetical protein